MTQGERVREVRKSLGLTLDKFGEKLGVQKSAISKIERGESNLTDANIIAICREFNVDYIWLKTGKGDNIFVDTDDDFLEKIERMMMSEDDVRKNIFKFMLELSDSDVKALKKLMHQSVKYIEKLKSGGNGEQ